MPQVQTISAQRFTKYVDDPRNAGDGVLSSPSINVRITEGGEAQTRPGYEDTGFDLAEDGKKAKSHYSKRWNLTFFSLNGKVKFIDRNNGDNVIDTGLALTATETTRFGEYSGDIYTINRTDGLRQIHVGRVNETSADSGDGDIKVDQHLAGRLLAFSDTVGTLNIATTTLFSESYSSVAATGVITLSNTLDNAVPDNTIVFTVEDISSNRPFGSSLTFWLERMVVWGVVDDQASYNATSIDDAVNTVYMSKFALRDALQNIIDFDTSGTASIEQVGKSGEVTNCLATRDYLYIFKEDETYFTSVADVNLTTGAPIPQLLSTQYGCVNEDSAIDMGNGLIAFMTNNNRIIGIKISTESGAAVVFPDEGFDQGIRNTALSFDDDKTNFLAFYHTGRRLGYFQVQINAVVVTLVFDNNPNIKDWLPPDTNKSFFDYHERNGVLFATDLADDTIYQIDIGNEDEGIEIDCIIATGIFESQTNDFEWRDMILSGIVSQDAVVDVEASVDDGT